MTEQRRRSSRPMEPFDTLMYRSEQDPRSRATLMGLFILDRTPDWDRVVTGYDRITRLVPQLRERVVEPLLPVTSPVWAVDPDFDLGYHIRRVRLPEPGTQQQLLQMLEPLAMAPFDRSRPLWELTLVEGLQDGSAAWVIKMSHAVADGVGGSALAAGAFEVSPDSADPELPPQPVPDDVTPGDLLRRAVLRAPVSAVEAAVRGVGTAARIGTSVVRRPRGSAADAAAYLQSLRRVIAGPPVEPSPLLRGRGLRRRLFVVEVPQNELRAASKSAGGSLNDGYLAAVCGGVRRYHEALGSPVASVPVAIPISLRTTDDPAGGNRWAGARLAMPVDETDPGERIRRIRELVLEARHEPAIAALTLLAPVAVRLPTWLLAAAFGNAGGGHDLQVSNVPGSSLPLYFAGARIVKMFPFGPVPGPAAMITLHSYVRTCFVGINLDPAAITEPELFAQCLEEGFAEVISLLKRGGARVNTA